MTEIAKLHILFLTYHLPLSNEPGAFRPWMEARLLKQAGFRVTVVTSGVQYMTGEDIRPGRGWCTEEWVEGIRILRTWAPKKFRGSKWKRLSNYLSFSLLAGLAVLIRVRKADRVLAGTDPIVLMPVVWLMSVINKAPLILDERDLYPETAVALGVISDGWLSHFWFNLQQFFRRRARNILAATPGIQDKLITYGVPAEKVHLLYNADVYLDPDSGQKNLNSLREKTGKKFLVGYIGGLGLANDIATLLRAAELLTDFKDIGIIIAGEGENRKAYEEYCRSHNLDNVFFLGPIPRWEALDLIREIDTCIQPLHPQKHFSHTLTSKTFDYHGLGKPMVFSGQGDTVRLLEVSGGGIALPSGDDRAVAEAIKQLYHDESLRQRMGASGRRWFETHISVDQARSLMKKVMDNNDITQA